VNGLHFSPDGSRLASTLSYWRGSTLAGEVNVWNAVSGERVLRLRHTGDVFGVGYSPDGARLASACGCPENEVKVWDALAGQEVLSLKGHSGPVWSVSFSPTGSLLASAGYDQTVRLWNAQTGRQIFSLAGEGGSVSFSPDGNRLASARFDGSVSVREVPGGRLLLFHMGKGEQGTTVCFTPDGKFLASSTPGVVRLLDAQTGQELPLLRHPGTTCACFSPNGSLLASGGLDGTVRFWDPATGNERAALNWEVGEIRSLAFAADGMRAAAGGTRGVMIWDVDA
jgi:WD40 repeat protein